MYLPLSNDAILCHWHYYVPNFKFQLPLQLLPSLLQLTEIWEILANHFKLLQPPPSIKN